VHRSARLSGARQRRGCVSLRRARVCVADASVGSGSGASDGDKKFAALRRGLEAMKKERWDAPPKPWKEFFAVRRIASVVEADLSSGDVTEVPVEAAGLRFPSSNDEAGDRIKSNAVYYRNNYAALGFVVAIVGSLWTGAVGPALASLCMMVSLVCSSNVLLGELQLATDGKIVFNDQRIFGFPRAQTTTALQAVSLAAIALLPPGPVSGLMALVSAVFWTLVLSVAHAACRPVSVQSSLASAVQEIRTAKNREELKDRITDVAKSGMRAAQRWAEESTERTGPSVFVRFTGVPPSPAGAGPEPPQPPQPPPQNRQMPKKRLPPPSP